MHIEITADQLALLRHLMPLAEGEYSSPEHMDEFLSVRGRNREVVSRDVNRLHDLGLVEVKNPGQAKTALPRLTAQGRRGIRQAQNSAG
jgi:predicted transcriptional regulator